jgi:MYXO-CTERM domain-containing protein
VLLLAALALAGVPRAEAQPHVDVLFYDVDGQVGVGATDFGPPFVRLADVRVFPVALDGGVVTSSPGFTASEAPPTGEPLPGRAVVSFDVVPIPSLGGRNLSRWDREPPVVFAAPSGAFVTIEQASCLACSIVRIDGSAEEKPGFVLGTTTASGSLHRHHSFFLDPPSAPAGVYLFAMRGWVEGLVPSEPFFVLLGKQASPAQLAAATEWVERNLLVPEPEATSAGVAAALALAALAGRRRRQPPVIESMIAKS